jgi:hypothetical protein
MIERYLKIQQNADGAIETRFETKHERELFYNERESSIWNYKNKGHRVAVQGANVSHTLFENVAPDENQNRTRGSCAPTFWWWPSNLGTQLPRVPLSGAHKNTYFATAPALNLKNEPILLKKWSGAGASTSSPGHFYGIRTLITYFSLPLPLPTLINCSLTLY